MRAILFALILLACHCAHAQGTTISINLANAGPGVKRTITIDSTQLLGCQPTSAPRKCRGGELAMDIGHSSGRRTEPSSPFPAMSSRFTGTWWNSLPESEGELKVMVFDSRINGGGGLRAETRMVTRWQSSAPFTT